MRFINKTLSPKVTDAIYLANNLLTSESKLITDIRYKNDWKYNTSSNLIDELLKVRPPISVFFYRSFNPFTKVLGYYKSGQIYINVKKVRSESFSTEDLVGLLLHEYSHYCGFTHGNNYKTLDKVLYSVPYYISENIKNWI